MKKIVFLLLIFFLLIHIVSAATIASYFTINETNETQQNQITGQLFLSPEQPRILIFDIFKILFYPFLKL